MSPLDVTQAVLVRAPERDTNQASQRLALFDEVTGTPYPFAGGAWITLTNADMVNGWHTFVWQDVPYPPQYRKLPNGTTELRGLIAAGNPGAMFTLPEDYLHTYPGSLNFLVPTDTGFGHVAVMPDGEVQTVGSSLEGAVWFGLTPIRYSIT
jgi:hypothetical protein